MNSIVCYIRIFDEIILIQHTLDLKYFAQPQYEYKLIVNKLATEILKYWLNKYHDTYYLNRSDDYSNFTRSNDYTIILKHQSRASTI